MADLSKPMRGVVLVVSYTGLISLADGITKLLAGGYEAAQIYAISGGAVAFLCLVSCGFQSQRTGVKAEKQPDFVSENSCETTRAQGFAAVWKTQCPGAMTLRALATVLAALCFFYAFRALPFAQVFLFIGVMPLMAGVLSGLILKEHIQAASWLALLLGFVGILFLFPTGFAALDVGHLFALAGAGLGTFSMVMARYISRFDNTVLPQVFFPNLALGLIMLPVLPVVWQPMPIADVVRTLIYAVSLFGARWLVVASLRLLPAFVVMPLMNLQFVWMLLIGGLVFDEAVSPGTWIGGLLVISSGLYLFWRQAQPLVAVPKRASAKLRADPVLENG